MVVFGHERAARASGVERSTVEFDAPAAVAQVIDAGAQILRAEHYRFLTTLTRTRSTCCPLAQSCCAIRRVLYTASACASAS